MLDKNKDKYDALISLGVEDLRPIKQTGDDNSDDALMKLGVEDPHPTKRQIECQKMEDYFLKK